MTVRVARVYDAAVPGYRVLVDRIWPRGLRKDAAELDEWCKDVAPSTELRTWFQHDPARFAEFRERYLAELAECQSTLDHLRDLPRPVILLTATRDVRHSHASVLAELLGGA